MSNDSYGSLDGHVISKHRLLVNEPIVLKHVTVGNFSVDEEELARTNGAAQRRFLGTIDEVLIANRAYSDQEMALIWRIGSPSQSTARMESTLETDNPLWKSFYEINSQLPQPRYPLSCRNSVLLEPVG